LKEKLRLIDGLVPAPVNAPEHKIPVARIDRAFERDRVADFPFVLGGQLPADHRPFAVQQKILLLLLVQDKFRIQGKVGDGFDAEIGEKILFIDIDAAEPIAPGNRFDAFHLMNFPRVGNGQGENDGNGVARHQPGGGRRLHARVKGADDRAQQTERQNGHRNSQNRERAAELVMKGVSKEDFGQQHR